MGNIANNKMHGEITSTSGDVNGVVAPTQQDINSNATGYNLPITESANHAAGWDGSFLQEGLYSNMEWSLYTMPTAAPASNGQVPTSVLDVPTGIWTTTWQTPSGGGGGATGPAGATGATGSVGQSSDTKALNFLSSGNTGNKLYKSIRPVWNTSSSSTTFNGEALYWTIFYADPGSAINSVVTWVQTAGAAGLGRAQLELSIWRSTITPQGDIAIGALEKICGSFSTLSTGAKVLTGINHTLSTSTYKNIWWMGYRNYQSGALSMNCFPLSDTPSEYIDVATSTTIALGKSFYQNILYTAPYPTGATSSQLNGVTSYIMRTGISHS